MHQLNFKSIRESIYEILRDRILTGHYEADAKLNEEELSREFNVSRSPIREAIQLLVGNGFARAEPYRGVYVISLSSKEIQDIYEFRILLENTCLDKGVRHLDDEDRNMFRDIQANFDRAIAAYDMNEYIGADEALHEAMVSISRNTAVMEAYGRISERIQPFRIFSLLGSDRYLESCQEHEGIITAILQGDAELAKKINSTHLCKAKNIVEYFMENRAAFLAENAEHLTKINHRTKFNI